MSFPSTNEIRQFFKENVVGQEEAIERLIVGVYNHFYEIAKGIPRTKLNILITGPTGSGKTFLLETLARILDVAIKQINTAHLVPAGYEGTHIDEVFSSLLKECDDNLERAEHSIVVWDEIDKRKFRNSSHEDIGQMVQQELLKTLIADQVSGVDTKNILQVGTGAFVGLTDIVRARLDNTKLNENEALAAAMPEDFEAFGMAPELMGRFPIRLHVEKLSIDDYRRILRSQKNSLLDQKRSLFEDHGFELHITEEAIDAMAEKAYRHNLGLRALQTVISDACDRIQLRFDDLYKRGHRRIEITEGVINKAESPKAVPSTKFTSKKADQVRRRMDELFERIKKGKGESASKSNDKNSGNAEPKTTQKTTPPEAFSFYPGVGESIFTEAERRGLKELLKNRQDVGQPVVFVRIRSWLNAILNFCSGHLPAINLPSKNLLLAILVGILTYAILALIGDERRGFSVTHTVRFLFCRDEFTVWHIAGLLFAVPAASCVHYRNLSLTARASAVGFLAILLYAGIIAFGARTELFSFKHFIFTWLTFLDYALWRPGHVSLWNYVAAAIGTFVFYCAFTLSGSSKPWDCGARVFRLLTGKGTTEETDLESTPYG